MKNKKTKTHVMIIIATLLILCIGLTAAYVLGVEIESADTEILAETSTRANLIFEQGADLNIDASLSNFSNVDGNASDSTYVKATLYADEDYYAGYDIKFTIYENEFIYTTGEQTAELILTIISPDGEIVEIDGLNYVTVNEVSGFDVTMATGEFIIANPAIIKTTANEATTDEWIFTLTFVNLETSQNENAGDSFNSEITVNQTEEKITTLMVDNTLTTAILLNEGDYSSISEAKNAIEEKGDPTWGTVASTNEGLYAIEDEYGTSYYFRGAVDNNWVIFGQDSSGADMYWRIVRINGDESIRLIYTGTTSPIVTQSVVMTGTSTFIGRSYFNLGYYNEYVGYMYEMGELHGHEESSTIKTYLESWYDGNLSEEDDLVADAYFCYDRTLATSGYQSSSYGSSGGIYTGTGMGASASLFGAIGRITASSSSLTASSTEPSLMCDEMDDQYTAEVSEYGNGYLTEKIGLLSADEVVFAGMLYGSGTTTNYLYRNNSYWTGSPFGYITGSTYYYYPTMIYIYNSSMNNTSATSYSYVAPVISISSSVEFEGTGTWDDPYKIM